MMVDNPLDTVIIGAGPAGIAAAIYLKRAGLNICVLEKKRIGGLLHNAHLVENYPGFHGVRGRELAGHMQGQLRKWGVEVHHETATTILEEENGFRTATLKDETTLMKSGEAFCNWHSKTVVVATGTVPRKMNIDGARDMEGIHLFYEVVDLPEPVSDKEVVIIGSGDAAFDHGLKLSEQGASVRILFRSGVPKCLPLLNERAVKDPNITLEANWAPISFREHNSRIVIRSNLDEIEADYVLGAIGREPNVGLIKDFRSMPEGLFVSGDVQQGKCRQVGIAVGDGIKAAMDVIDLLDNGAKAEHSAPREESK